MKTWVIIQETDDFIACQGISTDYHRAVGILYTKFTDAIDRWINDGEPHYILKKKEEWVPLEADTGFGFFAYLECKLEIGNVIRVYEHWYLLEYSDQDNDK